MWPVWGPTGDAPDPVSGADGLCQNGWIPRQESNLEFIYPRELFPTEVRASGLGSVTAGGRIGSATFLLPLVLSRLGFNTALFSYIAVDGFFTYRTSGTVEERRTLLGC